MTRHPALALALALAALPAHAQAPVEPDVPKGAAAARDAELAKLAAPLVDAFVNDAPTFTHDGKKVVFLSTRDGLPQPYVADASNPHAPAARLVTLAQRVIATRPTPDGKYVLFTSDHGADENWSIFRVGLDGGGLTELTPGEKLRRQSPMVPTDAPGTMYFTSRKAQRRRSRRGAPARRQDTEASRRRRVAARFGLARRDLL